jgi:hypothetical protein
MGCPAYHLAQFAPVSAHGDAIEMVGTECLVCRVPASRRRHFLNPEQVSRKLSGQVALDADGSWSLTSPLHHVIGRTGLWLYAAALRDGLVKMRVLLHGLLKSKQTSYNIHSVSFEGCSLHESPHPQWRFASGCP